LGGNLISKFVNIHHFIAELSLDGDILPI
jgi:hypothetical protein